MLGKKIAKITPSSIQKFELEDRKTGCHHCCIRDDTRVPHKAENSTHTNQCLKWLALLTGGPLANTLAFTSSSYLFSRLSKYRIEKEQKRHDLVIEQLQKVQVEWAQKWQERIDFINKQLRLESKAEVNSEELNDAMREYHKVFDHQLLPIPQRPVLSKFYAMSNEQHDRELVFIALRMVEIGGVLWFLED